MKVIDISLEIKKDMIIYPGDPNFHMKRVCNIPEHSFNLSEIDMGVHTGTHMDSPFHFILNGKRITDIPLDQCCGTCNIFNLNEIPFGEGIKKEHLISLEIDIGSIVLFKTRNSEILYSRFKEDFIYLSREAAEYLVDKKVKAVGIDYISIEKFGKEFDVHHYLLKNEIIIYEGLNLEKVKAGKYIFVGFPLKIENCEGSPTRAVLIQK